MPAPANAPALWPALAPALPPVIDPLSGPLSGPLLQVTPAGGGPLAFVGTFLLGWAFFAFTTQVAASFFLEDPPWRRAVVVGLVPAVASMALIRFDTVVILAVGLAADAAAIHLIYGVRYRTMAMMAALHYAVSVVFVAFFAYLLGLLSTAPG